MNGFWQMTYRAAGRGKPPCTKCKWFAHQDGGRCTNPIFPKAGRMKKNGEQPFRYASGLRNGIQECGYQGHGFEAVPISTPRAGGLGL